MTSSPRSAQTGSGGQPQIPRIPGLRPRLALARAAIYLEQLWPLLWPVLGIAGTFLAASWFGLLGDLPDWLHLILVCLTASAIGWSVWRHRQVLTWPGAAEGIRRIERHSGLLHRPLSSFDDQAIAGDPDLWAAHRAWLAGRIGRLSIGLPRADWPALDPLALRAPLILLLMTAYFYAGTDRGTRLAEALSPSVNLSPAAGSVDAWITPPAYTGRPPTFLNEATLSQGGALDVPQGSLLAVRVHGGAQPALAGDALSDGDKAVFATSAGETYESEQPINASGKVTLTQSGRLLARWQFTVIPDQPPAIALTQPVELNRSGSLALSFEASDDYGVALAEARFDLDTPSQISQANGAPPETVDAEADLFFAPPPVRAEITPPLIDLPLTALRPREMKNKTNKDLSSHPWAGLPVVMTLAATDDAGQTGTSAPIRFVLPERTFTKPLARAIVEQRRNLALHPDEIETVARYLDAFTRDADEYIDDTGIYLGLRAAYWRLTDARRSEELDGIYDLLWQIALRIEDGDLSLAEQDLRAAREALMDALSNGASDEEIEQLMAELREALNRYLEALSAQADPSTQPDMLSQLLEGDAREVDRTSLEKMLDTISELARTGAQEQARELLSQLDQILENMQPAGEAGAMSEGEAAMAQSLEKMSELIQRQRELMDRTFQHDPSRQSADDSQSGQGTTPGAAPSLGELQGQQQQLQGDLQKLMQELKESGADTPSAFGRAEQSMGQAATRLEQGRAGSAAGAQGNAIEQMREGATALADQLLQSMADRMGTGNRGKGSGNAQTDPLGRPMRSAGPDYGGDVEVPTEADMKRVRAILDELRRRASEMNRPVLELEYLDRLLKRF